MPPLEAKIVAVPGPTPVTRPALFTVATPLLLELHAMGRPVSTLFDASRNVAVAVVVLATWMPGDPSDTVTEATATAVTVTLSVALTLPLAAVMVVVPEPIAVTNPDAFTVAAAGLLLVHVMGAHPVRSVAPATGVAASCTELPITRVCAELG